MKKMTTTERRRLRKLEKFLPTVYREKFDMGLYVSGILCLPHQAKKILSVCGTSACAIGWAAYLFPKLSAKVHSFDFLPSELFGIDFFDEEWDFLFSQEWSFNYNSPEFAAKRISLYLEKGLPSSWCYDTPESEWEWL